MIEHLEKSKIRYVIATFDNPTCYVKAEGNCKYIFVENIEVASKCTNARNAQEIADSVHRNYGLDVVVLPLRIDYILLEEE